MYGHNNFVEPVFGSMCMVSEYTTRRFGYPHTQVKNVMISINCIGLCMVV